jgi:endonuclease/exonuclease/phosphatase family metal-dependent hydrolase
VQKVAAELGSQLHELTLGRARLEPWPHLLSAHGGRGTTGVAVMSRFPSERRGVLPLPKVWGDPARRRGALHVEIDVDGHPVDLVAVHLTSRLPHGPVIQMRHLWPQLPPPTRTAIVAGDHNFWGPGVVASLPRWRRAVRGRTWPAPRPHSQIDHILVRDGTRVVSSEVLPDVGSDHRPVRAHLQIS